MKNYYLLLLLACLSTAAFGQKLPFQGRLLDGGRPFNGSAEITFSIDNPVWTETRPAVNVVDGYYSVTLGTLTPLPDTLFAVSREVPMNITVNGTALSPVTLHSPLAPFGLSGSVTRIDSLETQYIDVKGEGDNSKAQLRTTANGYEGVLIIADSLNNTAGFLRSSGDETSGYNRGYLQLQGTESDGTIKSYAIMGSGVSQLSRGINMRPGSFVSLLAENQDATAIPALVDLYASDVDLNGIIPDGYRRGGLDISNYFGNPTHNLFSEHTESSTISNLNLVASQDGGGPQFNATFSSGDGLISGGNISLSDFDGGPGVFIDGTDRGNITLGNNSLLLTGNLNGTAAGGIEVFDAVGTLRAEVNGPGGRIDVFGPAGSNNVVIRGRGDGDFGGLEIFNNLGEQRVEMGSFGDNAGFLIMNGANGSRNIQLDRDPVNTSFGQFSIMDDNGFSQLISTATVDGGVLSLFDPTGTELVNINAAFDGLISIPGQVSLLGNFNASGAGGIEIFNSVGAGSIIMDGETGNINMPNGILTADRVFTTSGTVETSDRRLKKNISTIENALEKTVALRGVTFNWKDELKPENQIGVIAQEMEKVFPEFVQTRDDGFKAVNYSQMTAVLIEAIKELNAKVDALETENSDLKASLEEVQTLRKEMDHLMKVLGSSKAASK